VSVVGAFLFSRRLACGVAAIQTTLAARVSLAFAMPISSAQSPGGRRPPPRGGAGEIGAAFSLTFRRRNEIIARFRGINAGGSEYEYA
jgi:hypothetical protein